MSNRIVCEAEAGWADATRPHPVTTEAECTFCAGRVTLDGSDSLDAAWAEAEAALPDGWLMAEMTRRDREPVFGTSTLDASWTATANRPSPNAQGIEYGDGAWGIGSTPVEALRALTEKLRRPEGDDFRW